MSRKGFMLIAALPLAALLITPLLGCDPPRRHSWSRRYSDQNADHQRHLAADQRRRHEEEQRHIDEEQRHLDEERRQDRERRWNY
jgi:hypothetical protein